MIRSITIAATASLTLAMLGWVIFKLASHRRGSEDRADSGPAPVPTAADIHVPPAPFAAYGH